jgi:hypothetical protein
MNNYWYSYCMYIVQLIGYPAGDPAIFSIRFSASNSSPVAGLIPNIKKAGLAGQISG